MRGDAVGRYLQVGLICAVIGFAAATTAYAAPAAEAATVAHRLWDKLLTKCGDSSFYAGSVFDGAGMLSNVQVGHQSVLEFKGVRFNAVPIRVTDAERANGLSYRARTTMIAHLYREGTGPWQDGPDRRPRNTDDMVARAIGDVNSDLFDMGSSGAIALELVKFKGTWAATRSSTTMSGSLGFKDKYFDVDKLIALPAARYSCERAAVIPPPPSPAELAAKREAEQQQAEAARKAAEAQLAKAKDDEAHRQFVANTMRDIEAKLAPWRFEGPPDQFMATLRANLTKRGAEYGFDPSTYESELRQIAAMVQTCMALSPEDWKRAQAAFPSEKKPPPNYRGINPMTPRMRMLKGCDGGAETAIYGQLISPADKPYGLGVTRSISDPEGPSPAFNITVALFLKRADLDKAEHKFFEYIPVYSFVIAAKIPYAPSPPTG